ncbi:GDSL esterase/lipase 5-like isoform X2 [Cynara cardunculus var. scolymus]|uniref:GDSL esterase/lipase 5-like isoform X2 n=1 Tax=Cynara cardunculus var. scolymus TaxID=59895 RepID=UPI000D62863C|nr:GDSL esterase/lipase 5-like isoform X2 [Cynara cardunculus var. scolymus]
MEPPSPWACCNCFCFFFFFFISLSISISTSTPTAPAFFIFGDSFFDPGNNNYINTTTLDQSNFPPYGQTYFHFPTGRFSDGRIIPDFILEYVKLPLIPPYMDQPASRTYYKIGANFASAGAGALVHTFQGSELHKRGGRKFGFLNLGPLGCLPGIRIILNPPTDSGGCIEAASLLAKLHNKALTKSLKRLAEELHGFKYLLYDFNSNLKHRLKHPSKYGYKEGKTACCGTGRFRGTFSCGGKRPVTEYQVCENPNEYVFWDSYHLTERVYKEMAHQIWNQKPTRGTYNLKTLLH